MSERFIPLSVPSLQGNELKYVTEAIKTEWVSTAGPYIQQFEEKTAEYVKATGAVAVQNGTSGLHVALMLMNVSHGDEVIVPTLTFIAAVNPVKYIGAEPIFMDCDDSLCMDADKLLEFCQNECSLLLGKLINNRTKKHIKAILVVHVFGNMAEMEAIMAVADKFNLKVIEDATEALGTYYTKGKYKNRYAGTIGNAGVYSFNGNKIITTGGGGMIVSDDEELLKKAKHLTTQAKSDDLYYTHDEIGYNYRMTNIQAALGLAQLEQLEGFIEAKKQNYLQYRKDIEQIPDLNLLPFRKGTRPNYWFYAVEVYEDFGTSRRELIDALGKKNIQARPIWGLIHNQLPYQGDVSYQIEKAEKYLHQVVNLPCSSNLTTEEVIYITGCLSNLDKAL